MIDRFMEDTMYRVKVIACILAPIIIVYLLIAAFTYKKTMTAELISTTWERTMLIQRYQTVDENAWSVPDGGRVYDRKWEYKRSERYKSGSHTETYSCGTASHPKTCTRTINDYSTRRIYDWKYYYYIDKWNNHKVIKTSGAVNDRELIQWPNISDINEHTPVQLGDTRAGNPTETYTFVFRGDKDYSLNVSFDDFISHKKGMYKITVNLFGGIVKIERI